MNFTALKASKRKMQTRKEKNSTRLVYFLNTHFLSLVRSDFFLSKLSVHDSESAIYQHRVFFHHRFGLRLSTGRLLTVDCSDWKLFANPVDVVWLPSRPSTSIGRRWTNESCPTSMTHISRPELETPCFGWTLPVLTSVTVFVLYVTFIKWEKSHETIKSAHFQQGGGSRIQKETCSTALSLFLLKRSPISFI